MIESPFETKSDSFYFVNGSLIMHNKASYKVRYFDSNAGCILCLCYCCALAKQSIEPHHIEIFREIYSAESSNSF
jgi:hypothetical protein